MSNGLRLCGILLAASAALWAQPPCSNSVTLLDYLNLPGGPTGGCQFGNAIFSNFSFSYPVGSGGNPAASGVDVTVTGSTTSPTLNFAALWSASGGSAIQILIGYTISVLPSSPIEDTSIDFSGGVQDIGPDPPFNPSNITSSIEFSTSLTALSPSLYPSSCGPGSIACTGSAQAATGLGGVAEVTVGDLFTLDSGGTGNASPNTATLSNFQQTFSEAPEPSTLLAVGLGLLGCGWLAVRRIRRNSMNPPNRDR
jgi:hypothetical protein